jgi:hypothetical protein
VALQTTHSRLAVADIDWRGKGLAIKVPVVCSADGFTLTPATRVENTHPDLADERARARRGVRVRPRGIWSCNRIWANRCARVALIDPPSELQADCFSVRDGQDASLPGLTGARITLDTHGATPLLRISSKQPVNDPILQIAIATSCQASLQRNYVLLLDPPAAVELASAPPTSAPAPPPRRKRRRATQPRPRPCHKRTQRAYRSMPARHAAPCDLPTRRPHGMRSQSRPPQHPNPGWSRIRARRA